MVRDTVTGECLRADKLLEGNCAANTLFFLVHHLLLNMAIFAEFCGEKLNSPDLTPEQRSQYEAASRDVREKMHVYRQESRP